MLQVGHIERFSSAYRTLAKIIADPLYFESYRIAPWKNRGVEVDVILDLMIHDIDMIIGLVNSPVAQVDAVGTPVLGRKSTWQMRALPSNRAASPTSRPAGSATRPSGACVSLPAINI